MVVLALAFGPAVPDRGSVQDVPVSGAAVDESRGDPGNPSVAWTSNHAADYLVVRVDGPASVPGPSDVDAVVLDDVGGQVGFAETGTAERNQTVTVTVTAAVADGEDTHHDEERVVVLRREVTL